MKRMKLIPLSAIYAILVATLFVSPQPTSAKKPIATPSPAIYNPYPPGILPPDLNSELMRVQREIAFIEGEAAGEAATLPPLTFTGNPPIIHGSGYQTIEVLGKLLNFDVNISPFRNTACASCHMPYAAFSGPIPSVNLTMIAYPGTFHFRAGKRTAQRYTYSPDFPVLELDPTLVGTPPPPLAAFFGGNFWDGRATGYKLQSPDAQQAQGPRLIPRKWASPIPLASRSGFPSLPTQPSSSRYGAPVRSPISSSRTIPRVSAKPQEGRRCSAPTSSRLS